MHDWTRTVECVNLSGAIQMPALRGVVITSSLYVLEHIVNTRCVHGLKTTVCCCQCRQMYPLHKGRLKGQGC